jgi:hypothetical protein
MEGHIYTCRLVTQLINSSNRFILGIFWLAFEKKKCID